MKRFVHTNCIKLFLSCLKVLNTCLEGNWILLYLFEVWWSPRSLKRSLVALLSHIFTQLSIFFHIVITIIKIIISYWRRYCHIAYWISFWRLSNWVSSTVMVEICIEKMLLILLVHPFSFLTFVIFDLIWLIWALINTTLININCRTKRSCFRYCYILLQENIKLLLSFSFWKIGIYFCWLFKRPFFFWW